MNQKPMQTRMRKTVILGLGGTGCEVAINFKKEFFERFGELPGIVQIRVFDSALKTRDSVAVTRHDQQIKFSDVEYTLIPVIEPFEKLEQPTVKPWAPIKSMMETLRELQVDGSGQNRTSGRLALFLNMVPISQALDGAIANVKGWTAKKLLAEDPRFTLSLDPRINIYIVCSLAGGCGAGIFLDVANICRQLVSKASERRIMGVFLLPTIFEKKTAIELIYGNTYAACKELDYCQNILRESGASFKVDYGGELSDVTWGGTSPLFDHIYIVDKRQEAVGSSDAEKSDVMKFIARAILLNTLAESQGQGQDIMDNMAGQIARSKKWDGKQRSYMGWGMSTLEVPMDALYQLLVHEAVKSILAESSVLNQAMVDVALNEFKKEFVLTEPEMLGEKLLPKTTNCEIGILHDPRKGDAESKLLDWVVEQEKKLFGELSEVARLNCESLQKQAIVRCQATFDELISKGHIVTALELFKSLHNHLGALEGRIGKAPHLSAPFIPYTSEEYRDSAKTSIYPRDVVNATKGLLKGEQKEKAYEKWRTVLARERVKDMREYLQASYARSFLSEELSLRSGEKVSIAGREFEVRGDEKTSVKDKVKQLKASLEQLSTLIQDAKTAVETTISGIKPKGDDPFTSYLEREFVDDLVTKPSLKDVVDQNTVSIRRWIGQTRKQSIIDDLREFADSRMTKLKNHNIETVLKERYKNDPEVVVNLLKKFLEHAQPFWQVKENTKMPLQDFIILGVPEGQQSYIVANLEKARQLKVTAKEMELSHLPDPYKMFALVYKVAVPLFAIEQMETFRSKYLENEGKSNLTYHIDKRWVGGEGLPELGRFKEPEAVLKEKMMYWAIAATEEEPFKLIWRVGSNEYYAKPVAAQDKKKAMKQVKLTTPTAKGRLEAFEIFKDDVELYNGIKAEIESIMMAKGVEALEAPLQAQQQRLRVAADKKGIGEPLKEQLEAEIEAISEFIDAMKGIQ